MKTEFTHLFDGSYRNRRVLVTGHTGFKGSWLSLWLSELGADVLGLSLAPDTTPSHFELLGLENRLKSVIGDIRDQETLASCFKRHQPEVVFHLAAQSLVRRSYAQPIETFDTNVLGTAKVLEQCRSCTATKAIVVITTDKCYRNLEQGKPFLESDPLGGKDPYSASKAAAELVVGSYTHSFFAEGKQLVASARAGNVIGGGDWSPDRLLPDLMQACFRGEKAQIRNPSSVRPWQHVLDPLAGYLRLGQLLFQGSRAHAQAYNFGPANNDSISVRKVIELLSKLHGPVPHEVVPLPSSMPEAPTLRLDSSKASVELAWRPVFPVAEALASTYSWYGTFYKERKVDSLAEIRAYSARAAKAGLVWTKTN
jgi:CDP-glucose 4,6-dehydratase